MDKHTEKQCNTKFGFTMIEMVVSVGIFVVMTTLVLANYQKFLSTISLSTLASEIAVSVRQAQVYGQNVREFGSGSNIFPPYGIFFDGTIGNSFIFFVDILDEDKRYAGVPCDAVGTECLEKFNIQSRANIVSLCGNVKTDGKTINDITAECGLSSLDIAFTRPNPEASIIGVLDGTAKVYSDAEIVIGAPGDTTQKTVVVWSSGQISVE
jgi:type II secretory pathway pseudopilin PulG